MCSGFYSVKTEYLIDATIKEIAAIKNLFANDCSKSVKQ